MTHTSLLCFSNNIYVFFHFQTTPKIIHQLTNKPVILLLVLSNEKKDKNVGQRCAAEKHSLKSHIMLPPHLLSKH